VQPISSRAVSARRGKRSWRWWLSKVAVPIILYVLLIAGSVPFLAPLVFMISTSLKSQAEIFIVPIRWIPRVFVWRNYYDALFSSIPFYLYIWNTVKVVAGNLIGDVVVCALVAYGFARLRAPGKNALFILVLSTMMLPAQVMLIPVYVLFGYFKLIDSLWALILPGLLAGSAYFIFLLRQFFQTIHPELADAAKVDGCSLLGIWWRIYMPLSRPALATVAIFSFFGQWNSFLWPLILIHDENNFVISLGLKRFQGAHTTQYGLQMAASIIALLPCMLIFFLAQRYFVQGIVVSGVKG
jgi:ABC-type glycerol-3-phosphate transport system permease component